MKTLGSCHLVGFIFVGQHNGLTHEITEKERIWWNQTIWVFKIQEAKETIPSAKVRS